LAHHKKKFKNCINRVALSLNKEWFPFFCDEVVPPYVPFSQESCSAFLPSSNFFDPRSHILSAHFSYIELSAISSRSSTDSGLDRISVLLLQNISNKAALCLLRILNIIWVSGLIPPSWKEYHIIPIPKPNTSPAAYRPIAVSSTLCKIVVYIIKIRLDWFLEKNKFFSRQFIRFSTWFRHHGVSIFTCRPSLNVIL